MDSLQISFRQMDFILLKDHLQVQTVTCMVLFLVLLVNLIQMKLVEKVLMVLLLHLGPLLDLLLAQYQHRNHHCQSLLLCLCQDSIHHQLLF